MSVRARGDDFPSHGPPRLLIFLMFAIVAMAADAVGTTLPRIIADYRLDRTAAQAFHYITLSGIGIGGIALGFLADRIGHKAMILFGLSLFFLTSALFVGGNSPGLFILLLFVSGLGIGLFRSAALALIGALSRSTHGHAVTMNLVEGFVGIGAILGAVGVAVLLQSGTSWKEVYLIAALLCALLMAGTMASPLPHPAGLAGEEAGPRDMIRIMGDPHALLCTPLLMLCVATEMAVYVWAPVYFAGYQGANAAWAALVVSIFLLLRTAGRFAGAWLLSRFDWAAMLAMGSGAVVMLFALALIGGRPVAAFALPLTGLFLSVLYPTINSVGISGFDRGRHGSIAGILLFCTSTAMIVAPLAMAAVSERVGGTEYGMALGAAFSLLLAALCFWNFLKRPLAARLAERDRVDYGLYPPGQNSP